MNTKHEEIKDWEKEALEIGKKMAQKTLKQKREEFKDVNGKLHGFYWEKDVKRFLSNRTITPHDLHKWYLESIKHLHPESFNANANKDYSKLTEEQKFIDRFIAEKINEKQKQLLGDII
jgi:hypothetical protein